MKRVGLFFLYVIFLIHPVTAQSVITIHVHENGNALWTMEEYLPLINQAEINDWEEYIQSRESTEQYQYDIEEFRERIEWFIILAELSSDRSMNAENFNLSYDTLNTLSGAFGIVRFSFKWTNFSHTDSNKIFIGDVFSEGMVLSSDNILIIEIPENHEVVRVSPNYDRYYGDRLIWEGTIARSFDEGEPALVLSRQKSNTGTGVLVPALALGFIVAAASVILFKRKKSSVSGTKNNADLILNPSVTEVPEDEAMIEQILIGSGGQMYQSEIVKQSGFSKSKISIVLSKMKADGKIIKMKKGKGNIIRLVDK